MFFGLFSFHKKAIKSLGDVFETRPAPKVLIQTCQCIQMIVSNGKKKKKKKKNKQHKRKIKQTL